MVLVVPAVLVMLRACGSRARGVAFPAAGRSYSETVKPCSLPYLTEASCQAFRPLVSGVFET
jgi:hypothetical protein